MPTVREVVEDIRRARIREKEKLDKLLITLSAGTFVLSVTFVTGIIDVGLSNTLILFTSWGLLLLSIFSILFAYIIVDWHFARQEEYVLSRKSYVGVWGRVADGLTIASALLLMAGIVLLGAFAVVNILNFNKM